MFDLRTQMFDLRVWMFHCAQFMAVFYAHRRQWLVTECQLCQSLTWQCSPESSPPLPFSPTAAPRPRSPPHYMLYALWYSETGLYSDRIQEFWLRIYANICEDLETQIPFHPRLFVFGNGSVLLRRDEHENNWVQTRIMIGRMECRDGKSGCIWKDVL